MPRQNVYVQAFNRGVISPLALSRIDLERVRLAAEEQTNWMPRTLGAMMLRPGTEMIRNVGSVAKVYFPFVFSLDDTALLEFGNTTITPIVNDAAITVPGVGDSVPTTFASWTDDSDAGASTSVVSGALVLEGTRYAQAVSYASATATVSAGVSHTLRIEVDQGTVILRIGTTVNGQELVEDTALNQGIHYIAFTPTGTYYVEFRASGYAPSIVGTILTLNGLSTNAPIELEILSPWLSAELDDLRFDQSADVVYIASRQRQQYKLIRRNAASTSWSLELYAPVDGPFRGLNSVLTTTLTPSATQGAITLTASNGVFETGHVGALFRVESVGQSTEDTFTGDNQFSVDIRVSGVDDDRKLTLDISGTFTADITVQRSFGEPGTWVDYKTYGGTGTITLDDGLDNQIVYYRVGIKTGDYVSGSAVVTLAYPNGTRTGVVRITTVNSDVSADAIVLQALGSTAATENWYEGAWSTFRGFPTAVRLYEGRLWWSGRDRIWSSVSDDYESFDDTVEGDSGPISRIIGSGPIETIYWMAALQRMVLGGAGAEHSVRSSSFDEPLTPTNINIKPSSRQGSADVDVVQMDEEAMFVQRGGRRLFDLLPGQTGYNYEATDLTVMSEELFASGIVKVAVQRMPDTRVHCVMADGSVNVLVYSKAENVSAWVPFRMQNPLDTIVNVVVMPGSVDEEGEDIVYYLVRSSPTGTGFQHYLCKLARIAQCQGGTLNRQLDLATIYSGVPVSTISGLTRFTGRTVSIWADGAYRGTASVVAGVATLPAAYSNVVIGVPYVARYKSTKLAYAAAGGTAILQKKKVNKIGVTLLNTHYQGLEYGPDFDNLDPMPAYEDEQETPADTIWSTYDKDMFAFNGDWNTDSRVCLQATAPLPATVTSLVLDITTNG